MENHVVSQKLSQRLQELGVEIDESRFYWCGNKIIGKPITLHYLLKAIGKPYAISSKGHFLICPDNAESYENTLVQWNFSIEDNLETQLENPELLNLLKEILL